MDAVSLSGKTAIVTGANTGIGKETARELAKRGARVVLACRSVERAEEARRDIVDSTGHTNVSVIQLDLGSLDSVRQFAEKFNQSESRLDLLVNNAGVAVQERRVTKDGFELHFGTNHIGHFLLTNLLLDKLKSSAPSRVVTVSSIAHEGNPLDFDDLQSERGWSSLKSYGRSKTANVLFSVHLAKLLKGTGVTTYSVHPGFVDSDLFRDMQGQWYSGILFCCLKYCCCCIFGRQKNTVEGAQTTLYCCLEPSLRDQTGLYYSDSRQKTAKSYARDPQLAENLWTISAQLCKLPTATTQ